MSARETATELLCAALEGGAIPLREPGAPVDVRNDARALALAYRTLLKALRKGEIDGDHKQARKAPKRATAAAKLPARER